MENLETVDCKVELTMQHHSPSFGHMEESPELLDCCRRTITMHAKNNPMMVCGECKKIIKVFDNDKAYRNYQRFCQSRHRRFLATHFSGQKVIIFKNYDSYSA